jgi:Domain of unknown function (DUF4194)
MVASARHPHPNPLPPAGEGAKLGEGMSSGSLSPVLGGEGWGEGAARTTDTTELSALVIPLLKGVLYRDTDAAMWSGLLNLRMRVRDYVSVLGLELTIDEAEGYAFLRSRPEPEDGAAPGIPKTPRLIARRPLSFPVSLLLALLRKKLAEFDAGGGDTRLVLSRDEVAQMLRVFLPEGSNEARLIDQVDTHLNRIAELGFVRRLRGQDNVIEVQRILKAFVDAQWLAQFDERLAAYRVQLQEDGEKEQR